MAKKKAAKKSSSTKKKATKKAAVKQPTKKKPTKKKTAKKKATRKKAAKRELIDTGHDKRYVRRDEQGQFHEVDNQSRSLSQDRRKQAKTKVKPGQGDKGDQQRR